MFTKKRLVRSSFRPITHCWECGWVLDTFMMDPLAPPPSPCRSVCPKCGNDASVEAGRFIHEVTTFMGIRTNVVLVGWELAQKETPDLSDQG